MSCAIENIYGDKVVHDHTPLILCRYDGKRQIQPLLEPGVCYEKGTIMVRPEDACEPVAPLTDIDAEKDRICGILECAVDLTDEEACPITLTINAEVNTDKVVWPEGATEEQIDMLRRTAKGCLCFGKPKYCDPVPAGLQDVAQDKKVAAEKAATQAVKEVPVTAPDATTGDAA
jgi:hypothetical protein